MDVYGGVSAAADCFPIDDLLDFSSDVEHFTTTDTTLHNHQHLLSSDNTYSAAGAYCTAPNPNHYSADFTEHLCVPPFAQQVLCASDRFCAHPSRLLVGWMAQISSCTHNNEWFGYKAAEVKSEPSV